MIVGPVLGLLRVVPVWAWVIAGALAWGAWQRHQALGAAAELAENTAEVARLRERGITDSLIETNRRLAEQQEAAHAADQKRRASAAAAARADDRAASVQQYAAELAARARACDPAAAADGAAAGAPADLLADMLRRLEPAGRQLAAEADRRGDNLAECERRYDALSKDR